MWNNPAFIETDPLRDHIFWTLQTITVLATWERKIYGPICDRGTWHIRTNEELNTLYPYTDTVTDIKIRRLEWLDHLIRKEIIEYPRLP